MGSPDEPAAAPADLWFFPTRLWPAHALRRISSDRLQAAWLGSFPVYGDRHRPGAVVVEKRRVEVRLGRPDGMDRTAAVGDRPALQVDEWGCGHSSGGRRLFLEQVTKNGP